MEHRHGRCSFSERETMRLAMIGLGKMGGNMSERLLRGGHEVVAYDRSQDVVQRSRRLGPHRRTSMAAWRDSESNRGHHDFQ